MWCAVCVVECGVWCAVWGVRGVACGEWCVLWGVGCVGCGVGCWCVVWGVRGVACGEWCVLCGGCVEWGVGGVISVLYRGVGLERGVKRREVRGRGDVLLCVSQVLTYTNLSFYLFISLSLSLSPSFPSGPPALSLVLLL